MEIVLASLLLVGALLLLSSKNRSRIKTHQDKDGFTYRTYRNADSCGIHPDDVEKVVRKRKREFFEKWDAAYTRIYNNGSHLCPMCKSRNTWKTEGLTAICSCGHQEQFHAVMDI